MLACACVHQFRQTVHCCWGLLTTSCPPPLTRRTGQIVNVPVGPGTLGRVTDALGQPIDGAGPLINVRSSLVEVKAPGIVARQSVREPLFTGGCRRCCTVLCHPCRNPAVTAVCGCHCRDL